MAWWPSLPSLVFYLAVLSLALAGSTLLSVRFKIDGAKASLLCLSWVLGFCWCGYAAHTAISDRWPKGNLEVDFNRAYSRQIHWVEGQIVGLPLASDDALRFEFATTDVAFPKRLLVRWHRPNVYLVPGQIWQLPLRIDTPQGRLNFGGFDYEQYLLAEGIGGLARVSASTTEAKLLGQSQSIMDFVNQARQVLAEKIQANTTSLEVAALKRALLIGDRRAISPDLRDVLQSTGTAHLLAISGLHVGMVAGFGMGFGWLVWTILALARLQIRRRVALVISGWCAALGYAALAGFSLPTQRAILMLTLLAVALIWQRRTQPFDALLIAAFLVLLITPLAALSVGFWMSFLAVSFLIWGFAWRTMGPRRLRGLRGLFGAQIILSIGLLPINVGLFGQWSPTAFLANLVAIPWVGFVVLPSLLVSILIDELHWPISLFAWISSESLDLLVQFLRGLSELELGRYAVGLSPAFMMVFALFGAFWLMAPRAWPGRWLGLTLMAPLALNSWPLAGRSDAELDQGMLMLSVLDVGSGLSLMAETGSYRLMFDTGPGDGLGVDLIGDVLKHWPTRAGTEQRLVIDDLVLSHAHYDHQGGLGAIAQSAWVRRALIPRGMLLDSELPIGTVSRCHRGERWVQGPWTFEIVHPGQYLPDLGGNSGCVLWVYSEVSSLLMVGGLDAIGEAHISQMIPDIKADLLIVARSGHKDTTSEVWLKQLNPQMAVISVSANDPYGRPDNDLLRRLKDFDVRLLQTSECGATRLTLDPGDRDIRVETVLDQSPRFWRADSSC